MHVYFQIKRVTGINGKGLLDGSIFPSTERKELVDYSSDSENYIPFPLGRLAGHKLWAISAEYLMSHPKC